jgi:iron complex outermembrane receptor protein
VTASYVIPASIGSFDVVAGGYYNSGFYWNPDDRIKQPVYMLVNASATWTAPKANWDARLWGKNLTSRRYYSYETDQEFGDDASPAPPLTYGINVGYHFR